MDDKPVLDTQMHIVDNTSERRYYSTIPNIVYDLSDGPHDPAVYRAMLYCAGGQGKTCFASVRRLAEIAKVSMGQVHKSQLVLADNGFIQFAGKHKVSKAGQAINHWVLLDLWPRNMQHYSARGAGKWQGSSPKSVKHVDKSSRVLQPGEELNGAKNVQLSAANIDKLLTRLVRAWQEEPLLKEQCVQFAENQEQLTTILSPYLKGAALDYTISNFSVIRAIANNIQLKRSPGEQLAEERSPEMLERSPGETEKGTLRKEVLQKEKETDTNVSGQAPEHSDEQPQPEPGEGVSPHAQLENDGAPPPTTDDDKRLEFIAGIKEDPPQSRVGYSRALCGLVRRMRWYEYVAKDRSFNLAQFLARTVNKGFNGSDAPPPLVQLDRLLTSLMAAQEIPRPEKDVDKAWPWYTRRVQAIMESECTEVPPFDFRWTHLARGDKTWRDLLCPKVFVRP